MAVQLASLGLTTVTTAGTPVSVVVPASIRPPSCHAFIITARPANTGKIFIGLSGLNKTTFAGVLAILPIPTVNDLPTFSASLSGPANALSLDDLYLDADVSGDGVIIAAIVT